MSIAFIDLQAQRRRIADKIDAAVSRVIASGQYILGPEVKAFEIELAQFSNAQFCVANANGTDAIALPLMAWGIGPGDAVFCPAFTFAATAEVVPWTGATPVFVDVDRKTYNMSAESLELAIQGLAMEGKLIPRAVIAVDLFGQPADYPQIQAVCRRHGLRLIADSAQGFGCTLFGKHPLNWADCATTSFFPAKPLGCYGDGGATLTNSSEDDALLRSLAVHGGGSDKYDNVHIGMNSRLDAIQAAILREKLAIFADEIRLRNDVAANYAALIGDVVRTPEVIAGGVSTWAQYTIECEDRDGLAAHLKNKGVPTAIYYPKPLHQQTAYRRFPVGAGGMANTEAAAARVISLPMHPYLDAATQDTIARAVREFIGAGGARAPVAKTA
ncbi:MAG: DegT/DnrJ/EryC1/StrS aminotransferase family protein [Hyphomonadaceae bacterium]|nr:DegT/DnrJ/EryC1/StrS aminotransferase family protein [Hyphomonadaceae bacterium]